MSSTSPSSVREQIARARDLARALSASTPNGVVFEAVIDQLDAAERALQGSARGAFEASRPLGVLAVRELEDAPGQTGELRRMLLEVRDGLRVLAGLPYYA